MTTGEMLIEVERVLVLAILSIFGIQTTSFAALIAAVGIAIGAAWSGLLANFAAGAFLIVLRPFCNNNDYWQVFFDTNKAIAEVGGAAGWPVPAPHQVMHTKSA